MQAATTCIEVVPATEGWHVCEPLSDLDGTIDGLDYLPVIAWTVTYDMRQGDVVAAWAHPVVADVVLFTDRTDGPVLRRPDGKFILAENCEFATEAEVIEYLRAGAKEYGQQVGDKQSKQDGEPVPEGDLF